MLVVICISLAIGVGYRFEDAQRTSGSSPRQTSLLTIENSFRLFRGNPEALPGSVRTRLSRLLNEGNAPFEPLLVQRSQTNAEIVWAFLLREKVCLAQGTHGAAGCVAMTDATTQGISLGTFSPPSKRIPRPHNFQVLGLVPNGVARIEFKVGKGRKSAEGKNNLYSVSGNKPIFVRRLVRKTS